MATSPSRLHDALQDFQFPQREAAFFDGLFLRGHSAHRVAAGHRRPRAGAGQMGQGNRAPTGTASLLVVRELCRHRQHVLAIFEELTDRVTAN